MKPNMRISEIRFLESAAILAALLLHFLPASARDYVPSEENIASREAFSNARFGIFLHWGIYSMFGQGEWYLNGCGAGNDEYAKAAGGFYPASFDAREWVSAIKNSGAGYICFTTRHHDGFSMFDTEESPYNIMDATPFKRDIVRELADECHSQGIRLHLYYSLIDWGRDDYPMGKSGKETGKDVSKADYNSYHRFMDAQLTELLTNYGEIGAIWFDGFWDHDKDAQPFDWNLGPIYDHIHALQPACLVANNHHLDPMPGEDIQLFERDLPGENKSGYSGNKSVSISLPLETCETMNGIWGYRVADQNYKSLDEIVRLLVGAAGKGANLLLNIGPQPDGRLPQTALERLSEIGQWLGKYGDTIYGTVAGDIPVQSWGATTRKGKRLFVHVWDNSLTELSIPVNGRVKSACNFITRAKVNVVSGSEGVRITLPELSDPAEPERIIELTF
ncbi:MAG: alpha-L-fucosidase [Candidatus Cryptobacteroides sp.]